MRDDTAEGGAGSPATTVPAPATTPEKAGLRDLWPYLRPFKRPLVLVAVISLVATALALVQPLTLQSLIARVSASQPLATALWLLVFVTIAGALFSAWQSYLLQKTSEGVVLGARRSLVSHLLRLPVAEYDARRIGDLISRVGADTTLLRSVVNSGIVNVVSSVLTFIGAIALMIYVDAVLLAITLTAVLIGTAAAIFVARAMRKASRAAQASVGEMTASVERALGGIRTIRAAGATEREDDRVAAAAEAAYRAGVQMARLQALLQPIMWLAIQTAFIVVIGYGGYRVATGAMELASLVAFLLYMFMLVMPLGGAIQAIAMIQSGLAAIDRMKEVLGLPTESADEAIPATPLAAVPGGATPLLEFDRVSFSYADGPPVLREVSFAVARGSRTAIVGPSGAGKSSILSLTERFYTPTAGRILFDGVDVREMARTALRARMAYVEQAAPALAGSIADNLRLGAPDATDADLHAVLAEVGLSDIAERSPLGLAAPIGDEGILLSGGQRQRLAWARALLTRSELLLLDEPTASVDSRTEQVLQEALRRTAATRTVLVVAHRLATVADSDRIIVLDGGRVAATGTHEGLLETSPLYRELARHQLLV
ncbi:MAG: ABC transporter ATP-binding protein [Bauldia sp.]|nr:ABC transporter ATP-binding protein [Bauldia sp.]